MNKLDWRVEGGGGGGGGGEGDGEGGSEVLPLRDAPPEGLWVW